MEGSSQQIIPSRDEEFHSLQGKFKSQPENWKRLSQHIHAKDKSGPGNSVTLQNTESELRKDDSSNVGVEQGSEVEEVKMPSVKELAMKFKSAKLIQLKPPNPVKRISTTAPPLDQVSVVRPYDTVQPISPKVPNTTQKQVPATNKFEAQQQNQPTPVKRTFKPLKQSSTELPEKMNFQPQPEDRPQKSSPKTLPTENIKADQLDGQNPTPTPVKRTSSNQAANEPVITKEELPQVKEIADEQIAVEEREPRRQPPSTLDILPQEAEKETSEEERVISPPLPKTPPPNKVPFFPPVPKTPPPQKTPIFGDLIDSSLSIISPSSEGSTTEEILLSIIPGESILDQQNDDDVKWDVFAEINNNTKKSLETKLIFNAAATEVYERISPKEAQKTFLDEDTKEKFTSVDESPESSGEEKPISSEDKEELPQTVTDEQVTSKSEDAVDFSSRKSDEQILGSKDEPTSAPDSDDVFLRDNKGYYRQTSEINVSASPMKAVLSRQKSLPAPIVDTERRKTAMEVLATPPTFRPKEEEDLIKLRKQIVRASRYSRSRNDAPALK